MKVRVLVLLAGVMILVAPALAQNVLLNPSFEEGPFGEFPHGGVSAPYSWTAGSGNYWEAFTGVFDSTWKNHNCNYPIWPDPLHNPVDGLHFLAKWLPPYDPTMTACEYENGHVAPAFGHIRQTVTGLTPGATYYFSAWFANNSPHGWDTPWGREYPMFRVGVLPQEYDAQAQVFNPELAPDPTDTLGIVFAPGQRSNPNPPPTYLKEPLPNCEFAASDEKWRKLSGSVTLQGGQNAATFFVEFFTDTNDGYSEAQWVQVDACRLATTQLLSVENVRLNSFTTNSVTIEWDVVDGFDKVTGISSANCGVRYGASAAYGSYQGATELNPSPCSGSDYGKPGHYTAVLTGLTPGATYSFSIEVKAGSYTYMERYLCPGYPVNQDPVTGTRTYEAYSTPNGTFVMNPSLAISNVTVTNITATSADVNWTTSVPADSRADYGITTNYDSTVSNANMVTNHTVHLTRLLGHTTYNVRVSSEAPGYNRGYSANTEFSTALDTQIVNGDFELYAVNAGHPIGWKNVPLGGGLQLFHTPEWSVYAKSGVWYCGMIDNFSMQLDSRAMYQQIATVPGQVISLYAWSWANAHADCKTGETLGAPHRFGELNNQLGLDPAGGVPNRFGVPPATTRWSVPLSSVKFADYGTDKCGARNAEWRRLGICAIAAGPKATVYLRNKSMYANGWSYTVFDDVEVAPPTAVHSVGELKSQPFQTNVNLTQPAQGGYVVTYVAENNPNIEENEGMPYFYIQDAEGGPGIKVTLGQGVAFPAWLAPGKKVNIIGTLDWGVFFNYTHNKNYAQQLRMNKPAGEPVLRAIKIDDAGDGEVPAPVGVTNLSLGGGSSTDGFFSNAGVAGGAGACNVGMRVRTWGKIVEMDYDGMGQVYMVIDDGSAIAVPDQSKPKPSLVNQTQPGVYVPTFSYSWPMLDDGSRSAQAGDYVVLTGVSGVRLDLDWDDEWGWPDPQDSSITIPQAMKNMRAIKIESAQYMALPE